MFLDELATTSPLVQEKLLRIIEYGEFERVGGSKTLYCDVRLVAATNQDLPQLASEGRFRVDLLDRLAFDVITLPPLREREDDIMLLAEHFAINMTAELNRDVFAGFSADAQRALQEFAWPGNIRELKNVVERCVYRAEPDEVVDQIVFDPFESPYRPRSETTTPPSVAQGNPGSPNLPLDLKQAVKDFEVDMINTALEQAKHNQRKAAELLDLTYHQFRGYLKKYEILKAE